MKAYPQNCMQEIQALTEQLPTEVNALFWELRRLVYESAPVPPTEKLWAKLPSYDTGNAFVRLIPFKDHINIEAQAVSAHRDGLKGYRITPKGMLQIFTGQPIPEETLRQIFTETFGG